MQKLTSLTIFFPFFNDAGTVEMAIRKAYQFGPQVATKLEVIAIHGGNSHDQTFQEILKMKKKYPSLRVLNCEKNRDGYAVIKHGFLAAKHDWVFYTDGDLQYRVEELPKLVEHHFVSGADVINGYKSQRADNPVRILFGSIYAKWGKELFQLPIRDLDCDFRLIRRKFLPQYFLTANAAILAELIIGLVKNHATFAEIEVTHQPRIYGHSNYHPLQLLLEKISGDLRVWILLKNSSY